ncbi:MAG: DUF624 domain-containing protein [Ruminococcus sp.]|nr:DUF624 domain-containing protein [Ruminococcus sp.]
MSAEKNSVALSNFFTNLFHNLPKLLFANLLFAIPFAFLFGIFYLVQSYLFKSIFVLFLTVIPLFPFYAGVTQVTAHMARGEEDVEVFHNFIAGVKDNFGRFLFHGTVVFAAIVFSYFSISLYITLATSISGFFYVLLAISIIIAIIFLFAFFYLPSMTVTFDLSMKNIYKNSMLMTFGEFKHNLIATFGLFILALICATALFCCGDGIALIIVTAILGLFIVPSIMSYLINCAVYNNMYSMITSSKNKMAEIDQKLENRRNGQLFDAEPEMSFIPDDFNEIEIDDSKDGDEYIFYNGKMVKRSVLIKQKQQTKEDKQ